MDGMIENGMAQAMKHLSYFDPFMLVNRSGTCACSRLLQTRNMGVYQVSVEEKVQNEAGKPGPNDPQDSEYNTKPFDFKLMHRTILSMRHCEAAVEGSKFVAVLFEWQVAESIARKPVDYGRLVFVDPTTTRFVVVELCIHECTHVKQRAEQRAHIFFCLAKYLGYAPKWVRYATSTPEKPDLPTDILKPDACQPGSWKESFARYGFGQVDETNFKAALGQNALDAMEVIINRSKHMAASVAEYRQAQGGRAALKEQVLQTSNAERGGCLPNEAEAPLPLEFTGKFSRHCASCHASEEQAKLMKCARCQMKWYCSRACQKAHWKLGHKLYCVQAPEQAT